MNNQTSAAMNQSLILMTTTTKSSRAPLANMLPTKQQLQQELHKHLSQQQGHFENDEEQQQHLQNDHLHHREGHDGHETLTKMQDVANNISATISSIRTNVTRVLHMYFQNVTDTGDDTVLTTMETQTTLSDHTQLETTRKLATNTTAATAGASKLAQVTRDAATNVVSHVANIINTTIEAATSNLTTTTTATSTGATSSSAVAEAAERRMSPTSISSAVTAAAMDALSDSTLSANLTAATHTITYPKYRLAINSFENCSAVFANYTQPQPGLFCNWKWDTILCWPPTPAGVLARLHCPSGWHGIDPRKYANRKCELDGNWGTRPNETDTKGNGWTDYKPCFKPEVTELLQQINDVDLYMGIAKRTRTLEIVGLILSLLALIVSLIIFYNFRSLRNNRTKIHKNLFFAMVLQVIVRLTLYLDQAFRRGKEESAINTSISGIENTPYLCEASYVLLEYARTAMFMWMFIEGLYLHNMVTVAVFQGRFPHTLFSLLGWGLPVLMTTVWAVCTAVYMDSSLGDCFWNYNLTPYYWILEGPRLIVIVLNFCFLVNIIRVLVVKLRQSQASDIEQTRKAVRAAIVLLPLLGITNLLHLVPDLKTPWKFALWSYGTHFLTSFQGFFIALIYCFLNGEVRAVLLKSIAVYLSVRGHPEWVPKRASMYSGAYNTAPDTDALQQQQDTKRVSPPNRRFTSRKASSASIIVTRDAKYHHHPKQQRNNLTTTTGDATSAAQCQRLMTSTHTNNNSRSASPNNNNVTAAVLVMETNDFNTITINGSNRSGDNGNGNGNGSGSGHVALTSRIQPKKSSAAIRFNGNGNNRSGRNRIVNDSSVYYNASNEINNTNVGGDGSGSNWMLKLCFRGQKNKCVMSGKKMPQQIFSTSQTQINTNYKLNNSNNIIATSTTTSTITSTSTTTTTTTIAT